MNERVREQLREIVERHGRPVLSDARLCESLLKDYCGQYKKEIFVLVCALREQVAADLLTSQDAVPREMLHALLIKRLQNNLALTEDASRWAVESWARALVGLSPVGDGSHPPPPAAREPVAVDAPTKASAGRVSLPAPAPKFEGEIIGRCEEAVRSVACAPDGESIVCGSDDATIRRWRFDTRRMEIVCKCAGAVSSVAYSPDGACVAAACEPGSHGSSPLVSIRELHTGETSELGECGGRSPQVAYSPGGHSLAVASAETEHSLRIWNLRTGHARVFKGEACGLSSISFSPTAASIATGESGPGRAALGLHDADAGRTRILGHCDRRITSVAFSPDGQCVAAGSWDETVRLWSVTTGRMRVLGKNCSRINCIAFSRCGEWLAACSLDGRIRIWNVRTARVRTLGEWHGITASTFSADGRSFIAGSRDGTLRRWPLISSSR
jgi:hypothetical protein